MAHPRHFLLSLAGLALLLFFSCKNRDAPPPDELASLKLIRGDVLLCGNGQFGKVNFTLGCDSESRETFGLGLSLLHSFEYTEAEKAFAKVIDIDPSCGMAYWGVAMCNFHPLWAPPTRDELVKGSEILRLAKELKTPEKVRDYLNAIDAFYSGWEHTNHKTRTARFERQMAALRNKYPEDTEASIFYALALNAAADPTDKTYTKQREAGTILEGLYAGQPDHPGIAHYIIHNYDYPELAEMALPIARRYARIAPASAHAQHMPSHIFTRLGLWGESIQSNLNSTASALCYSQSLDKDGHWDEELHGMDYLAYAYLQVGEQEMARQQLAYLLSFKKVFPINFKVAYAAAAIPSRIALENRDWAAAAQLELPLQSTIPWDSFPWQVSILKSARTLGLLKTGDLPGAEKELGELKSLQEKLQAKGDDYAAGQVAIQLTAMRAWASLENGHPNEALVLMQEATRLEAATTKHPVSPGDILPAGELLGDMFMELKQPGQALAAYEADMLAHPNRFNGLYGAAMAARACGEPEKARRYFQKLLVNSTNGLRERPELETASTYLTRS